MKALTLVSDLHCGSALGLCPPDMPLVSGGTWRLSKGQGWIWDCWCDFVGRVPEGSHLFLNGDVVQGINRKDGQLVSTNPADQEQIALVALRPLADKVSHMDLTYGTEWHEGPANHVLYQVYLALSREFPGKVSAPDYGLWRSWEGKLVHISHHRAFSRSPVATATPLATTLARMLAEAPKRGGAAPDIVIRAHGHTSMVLQCGMGLAVCTAGWQLHTAHGIQLWPEWAPEIGGMILTMEEGEVLCHERVYRLGRPEVLPV